MLDYLFLPFSNKGLADERNALLLDKDAAHNLDNIIIGTEGQGETRPVINQVLVSAFPSRATSIHEHINARGSSTYFAGTNGTLYTITPVSGAINVPVTATSFGSAAVGWDAGRRIRSTQMGNRMIFYNGTNRAVWTEDGTTFDQQRALSGLGSATANTSATSLRDSDITSWLLEPVAIGDIVFNRTENGYGLVTAIVTGRLTHTAISSAATGIGTITNLSSAGHTYEIIDTVALNVVPSDGPLFDNIGLAGATTGAGQITVSAVTNWFSTEIRVGDYIRNTTRDAVTQVTAIASATLGVNGITSQVCGDSLVFYKDAFPIPHYAHTYFDRLYAIDVRQRNKVRVTTKGDPSDLTVAGGTLDSLSISVGAFASEPENFEQITSFHNNIVFGGDKHVLLFRGGDPIADVSGALVNFDLTTIISKGVVSQDAMLPVGSVLLFAARDGIQAVAFGVLDRAETQNISGPLTLTTQAEISRALEVSAGRVRMVDYPQRQIAVLKAGTTANLVLNYQPQTQYRHKTTEAGFFLRGLGTWTEFTGQFAETDAEFVDSQGRYLCAFTSGNVNYIGQFDALRLTSSATPDRATNSFEWSTPLRNLLSSTGKHYQPEVMHGKFVSIHAETVSGANPDVTISVRNALASAAETAGTSTITLGPTGTETNNIETILRTDMITPPESGRKYPLRWRGTEAGFDVEVSGLAPLSVKGLGIWYSKKGRR